MQHPYLLPTVQYSLFKNCYINRCLLKYVYPSISHVTLFSLGFNLFPILSFISVDIPFHALRIIFYLYLICISCVTL